MTSAFPAATVLTHLSVAEKRDSISALQGLTAAEREVARDLLTQVGPAAVIDAAALARDARSRAVEQAAAKMGDGSTAWLWGLHLMPLADLERLRTQLQARVDRGEGDQPYEPAPVPTTMPAYSYAPAAPASDLDAALDALDGLDDTKPKRRSLPRVRSRRDQAPPEPRVKSQRQAAPMTYLGGRVFDQYGALDGPDPSYRPMRPPWLLSDPDDDETDETFDDEGDDEDADDDEI